MFAEQKIELPRTFKESNPDSLLVLALHRLNYPDLQIVTKNENILGSCHIVLYFHVWKIVLVFDVTDFVCDVNLTSEQKAVKHCFISGAHCCVTAIERNRRECVQPENLWRKKKELWSGVQLVFCLKCLRCSLADTTYVITSPMYHTEA